MGVAIGKVRVQKDDDIGIKTQRSRTNGKMK